MDMDFVKSEFAKKLGLDKLPEAERQEALIRMSSVIFRGLMIRVIEMLKAEDQAELDRMVTKDPEDTDAIFAFLASKVPGFDAMLAEEIELYAADAIEIADQIK